jgi:hypothetical protein
VIRPGVCDLGFESRQGKDISLFSKLSIPASKPSHPLLQCVRGGCFLGHKAAGPWNWPLNLYLMLRIRMNGAIPQFPHLCLHCLYRDNFTFYNDSKTFDLPKTAFFWCCGLVSGVRVSLLLRLETCYTPASTTLRWSPFEEQQFFDDEYAIVNWWCSYTNPTDLTPDETFPSLR